MSALSTCLLLWVTATLLRWAHLLKVTVVAMLCPT